MALAAAALATGWLLVLHHLLPDIAGLGSLVETFLPWSGLVLLALGVVAVLRRAAGGALAVLFSAGAWLWLFWPLPAPASAPGPDLVVVQHNVADTNSDPGRTAAVLLEAEPDVVTLVEVTTPLDRELTQALGAALPYREVRGTVGVWSRYPLLGPEPVDLRPPGTNASWERGMRVVVDVPGGTDPRVYAVHAPSVRLGPGGLRSQARDHSLGLLGEVLADDDASVVVVGGDLNATLDDRALGPVLAHVSTPRVVLGATFPAPLPVVRIDHVLARGADVTRVATLGRTGSDHLPVVADVRLPPG
ncbi:endonuclease/exonuclease/phosphatase family protein [Isoptericola halotolerans]|uniref:endonuclease/exonuclease/phosphatase family protein n=1 Tax=Isoptericola halotolerans TaxID=300560 RepID=UPI00388F1801